MVVIGLVQVSEELLMNRRTASFRLVMSSDERQLLMAVAKHLRRSESDALRWLLAEAAEQFLVTPILVTTSKHGKSSQPSAK